MAKQQFKNKCIFCSGESTLSDEHFVPQWLSEAFPMEAVRAKLRNKTSTLVDGEWKVEDRSRETNPMHTITLRCFCRDCNGGWMSVAETNAKNVIQKIQKSLLFINISHEEVTHLALWIALLSIKLELLDKPNKATPDVDINYLYENRRPPDRWNIWMAPAASQEFTYSNTGVTIANHPSFEGRDYNCRSVSFIAGGILFVALTMAPELEDKILHKATDNMRGIFVKLWPRNDRIHNNFKSMKSMDIDLADYFSKTICGVFEDSARQQLELLK